MEWDWYTPDPKVIKTIKRRAAHVVDVGNMQVWRSQHGFSTLIKEEGGKVFVSTVQFWSITEAVREANTRI